MFFLVLRQTFQHKMCVNYFTLRHWMISQMKMFRIETILHSAQSWTHNSYIRARTQRRYVRTRVRTRAHVSRQASQRSGIRNPPQICSQYIRMCRFEDEAETRLILKAIGAAENTRELRSNSAKRRDEPTNQVVTISAILYALCSCSNTMNGLGTN